MCQRGRKGRAIHPGVRMELQKIPHSATLQTQKDVYIKELCTALSMRQRGWILAGMTSLMSLPEATGRSEANFEPLTHGLSITEVFPWLFFPQYCLYRTKRGEGHWKPVVSYVHLKLKFIYNLQNDQYWICNFWALKNILQVKWTHHHQRSHCIWFQKPFGVFYKSSCFSKRIGDDCSLGLKKKPLFYFQKTFVEKITRCVRRSLKLLFQSCFVWLFRCLYW